MPGLGFELLTVAFARDRPAHQGFVHAPGVRETEREARTLVPLHPVIDPVAQWNPLDAASIAVYLIAFIALAYATSQRPSYGIAALILCGPFDYSHDVGHTTVTLGKIALLATATGLLLARRNPRALLEPTGRIIFICGIAVVLTTALSFINARYHGAVLRETLKATEYVTLFAAVAIAFAADADERPVRFALLASAILVSILALAQEFFGAPSGLWFHDVPIPRIAGPLEGPNQLAAYLGLLMAPIAAYAVRRRAAPVELIALFLATAALVLTISRSGLIASLAGLIVVLIVRRGPLTRQTIFTVFSATLVGLLVVALWGFAARNSFIGIDLLDRFSTLAEADSPGRVGTRSELWHAAYVLWRTHPLLGIGAGNYERELGLVYPGLQTHSNSLYIQSLVEGGVPLLAATLALVFFSIARFARGPFADPLITGMFGASIGLAGHQVLDLLVFYPKVGELWWILLALAAVRVDALRSRQPKSA